MKTDNQFIPLLNELEDAVVAMDEQKTIELSYKALELKLAAYTTIDQGLVKGMMRAGELFEKEEYFIPELLMCSDAMNAGLDILRPHLERRTDTVRKGVVIGVVRGDTHDIGKNIVRIMLDAAGYDVIDLGRDIPPEKFIESAVSKNAGVIALSTLMTTTMGAMAEVVQLLVKENIRERFKVVVGGGPISQQFADKIGADGYAANAVEAIRLLDQLTAAYVSV